jgi:hypothetical protein
MWALDDWRNLLLGSQELFEILTDHRNLTYFHNPQKLTGRQGNWMMKLQDYDFIIKYVGGETNRRADVLLRLEGVERYP